MKMILSMSIIIFTFKDQNFAENLTNLAKTLKKIEPCWVHGACFFQLQGPLAIGGPRTLSTKWSGSQDCQGKGKGPGRVEHCCLWRSKNMVHSGLTILWHIAQSMH